MIAAEAGCKLGERQKHIAAAADDDDDDNSLVTDVIASLS